MMSGRISLSTPLSYRFVSRCLLLNEGRGTSSLRCLHDWVSGGGGAGVEINHQRFSSRFRPTSSHHGPIIRGKKSLTNNSKGNGNGGNSSPTPVSQLFVPVPVKIETDVGNDVGVELTGDLKKQDVLRVLNKFFRRSEIKLLSLEHGLDSK